jgi:NAD(P)-dependent dehydrogenase (short-subunit alcohol dehydrogenase family)
VVTGAAGGIGLALARQLAAEGMNVVIADVDGDRLAAAAEQVGGETLAVPTDVGSTESVEALARDAAERFGDVHLLCNNAGVTLPGVTWEFTQEEWNWVIRVNLLGVVHGLRAFVPAMIAHGEQAHVVNTASIGGLVAFPGLALYAATKYGVVGLSETLAGDLARVGARVGVSVLCPGPTETDFRSNSRSLHPQGAEADPSEYEGVVRVSPASVAEQVVAAIRDGRFWILTHPEYSDTVTRRTEAIVGGGGLVVPRIV